MIEINKTTGCIYIENVQICPDLLYSEIGVLSSKYTIVNSPGSGNEFNRIYIRNIGDGEITIGLAFAKERLVQIRIVNGSKYDFPPFTITKEDKEIILQKLETIGGEQEYTWGTVELSEDLRGGSIGILIGYNKR
ncbi:hypothetical protein [Deminuibacter soli]|uniref:Uncharacterized protein n=1 Tax=Deminuibacter soli TaxID=2291815 RepID=A0A3E1NC56_9BACT|nr:hypothetical protein [Deminuibacter soli]RFM25566.1 hypothetical protein DXN05_24435 [Deminuibacter soli]